MSTTIINDIPVNACSIADDSLRLSFFRLHPKPYYEKKLMSDLRDAFGENLVILNILGRYDLACIYPTILDYPMLYRKSLEGIRSFSNIDCVCWNGTTAPDQIKLMQNKKLFSIVLSAMKEDFLVKNGGIHNQYTSRLVDDKGAYLTSLAWGEQVAILWGDTMDELWKNSRHLLNGIKNYSNDLYQHFAINMDFIAKMRDDPSLWNEAIDCSFSLFWKIDLINKNNALEEFQNRVTESRKSVKADFNFYIKKRSATNLNLSYNVKDGTWSSLINTIREIRSRAYQVIASTRLNIYESDDSSPKTETQLETHLSDTKIEITTDIDKPVVIDAQEKAIDPVGIGDNISLVVVSDPANGNLRVDSSARKITYSPNSKFYGRDTFAYTVQKKDGGISPVVSVDVSVKLSVTVKDILLTADQCESIQKKYPIRVAKIIIQAIYSITDIAFDPSMAHLSNRLIFAAKQLIDIITGVKPYHKFSANLQVLDEAETLMRAARQRLANIPPTRDMSKLPFEMPPPGVRIIYEACEFVIDSLLNLFNKPNFRIYKPYVLIDSVDNPKHTPLSIKIPDHMRGNLAVYPPISHEIFHSLAFQSGIRDELPRDYIVHGRDNIINTTQIDRLKIIEEIFVEILDFIFSFNGNYDLYKEAQWVFFANHFKKTLKDELQKSSICNCLLRTFSVKLWQETTDEYNKPSEMLSERPKIREMLRAHIDYVKEIIYQHCNPRNLLYFFNNITHQIQAELDSMREVLDLVWRRCNYVIEEQETNIKEISEYAKSDELDEITNMILDGFVVNRKIQYPHVLIHNIAMVFRNKEYKESMETRTTMAMLLSLWNSRNIRHHC